MVVPTCYHKKIDLCLFLVFTAIIIVNWISRNIIWDTIFDEKNKN